MSNSKSSTRGGISFAGLLTIVFIALKLTGHIDWSWWWVLSPLWITPAFFLAICALIAVCCLGAAGLCLFLDWWDQRKDSHA